MSRLHLQRHAMPGSALIVWTATALVIHAGAATLALGVGLLVAFWLVEARGIEGGFAGEVPKHPIVMSSRVLWLFALAFALVDAERRHDSSFGGWPVRLAGAALFMAGLALRLWSMRTLRHSFSYDVKVPAGQELVTRGPYARLRHPAYTGIVLLSVSCGVWNPSLIGLVALAFTTLPQVVVRIAAEERLLAGHFGRRWDEYARHRWRLIPLVW